MDKMPEEVKAVRRLLSRDPSDELYEISQKLIDDTPDLIRMWNALERRKTDEDDLWVWIFLTAACRASTLPPYHYISASDRRLLADDIKFYADTLSRKLKINGLDVHLIFNNGKNYNGIFLLEDFEEPTQAGFIRDGVKKVKISKMIEGIAKRSQRLIAEEPLPGKAGKNVRAIRFIRLMAERNIRRYGQPLYNVIATAVNAIFEISYLENEIIRLISR